jgi:NAD(P)H-dependent FMN reductase
MVKIVDINGSLRAQSYSAQALKIAATRVCALGADVEIFDLRKISLPFCDGGEDYLNYSDVERLSRTVKEADGLILATPNSYGSVSSALKNALDLMGFEELSGKVTGALSVLG